MTRWWILGGLLGVEGIVFAGCGSDGRESFDPAAATEPAVPTPDAGSDAPRFDTCEKRCSKDLHSIVDCNERVVSTCADNEGCAAGKCITACDTTTTSKTTAGCDYYIAAPDHGLGTPGSCFAALVANTWGAPITLRLERDGQTLDIAQTARIASGSGDATTYKVLPDGKLPPGEVAVVFLSKSTPGLLGTQPCPPGIIAAVTTDPAVHGTGSGEAFHLTASAPIVAYDIYPYARSTASVSATLLLPTSTWDTNYVAVDAYAASTYNPWISVVASEDKTQVTILPTVAIAGVDGGMARVEAGTPAAYTLNRGQFLQLAQPAELVGSPIQANKPIGLVAGHGCMNIPTGTMYCDGAHQQIPPVKALGSEYVGVRYRNRYAGVEETTPWRLVGAVNGTALTWEPSIPPGAPTTLSMGQMAEFESPGSFVVRSQDAEHPFYAAQYMTGCKKYYADAGSVGPGPDCRGDPEFVNMIAAPQYLDKYVFFTSLEFPETHLVVVRKKAADGSFKDVSLDCAGTLKGWKPVGTSGLYESAGIDLVTGNFEKVNGCDNGRHEMKSEASFGVTVWGWGTEATKAKISTTGMSYAYPAGMGVVPVNKVVVPATPK